MRRIFFLTLLILLAKGNIFAQEENNIDLEAIVVTPSRSSQSISEVPSSVSVISQYEINNSNADTSIGALKGVPGIIVRDVYGNSAKTSVDLRGFGDMDYMNNLVLVDGRRVNEVDLSGVDWNQIPLDQIQKIEVIRGGNSVLYGENAIGGVINIITKKGTGKPKLEIGTEYGSFDKNLEKLQFSGSEDKFSYLFNASRGSTNGYRNNTFFKTYDYGTKLGYDFSDTISAHFDSGFHRASYGLPGALTEADINNFGRRFSKFGQDSATDKDYYFMTGAKGQIPGFGELALDLSYRVKDVNSDLIGGNGGFNPLRLSHITTLGLNPKLTVNAPVLGKKNNLITGIDFCRSFYSVTDLTAAGATADITNINKYSAGAYAQEEFFVSDKFSALGGFRYEAVKYAFNFHDNSGFSPDTDSNTKPNEKAYNFGLNYKYTDDSNIFLNLNKSYRFPAVDEFLTFGALDTTLKPQVSQDIEAGIRHNFGKLLHVEISGFRMKIKNELFTDPTASGGLGATSNYGHTIHQGMDLSANLKMMQNLSLYGAYSFLNAEFFKGPFGGKNLPWVPEQKVSLGLRYEFIKDFAVNLAEYYIGSRFRINDVNNAFGEIKGYLLTDLGLSYSKNNITISASINNLFNQYYYEFASYGVFSGNKVYYPAPGRNFGLKLDYKF